MNWHWPRAIAAHLVVTAVLGLLFVFLGGFSLRQSLVLALSLALVLLVLFRDIEIVASPFLRFDPYWMRVSPQWYDLLTDFKLIGSAKEWDTLEKYAEKIASRESRPNILTHAICLTVLKEASNSEGTLIYWNLRQAFSSRIDFEEQIEPVDISRLGRDKQVDDLDRQLRALDLRGASFFVVFRRGSYDLGLIVPEWWWDENRGLCPKPVEEDRRRYLGQVRLTVARIPSEEFYFFYARPTVWRMRHAKTKEQLGDLRDEQLVKFGWKREEHDHASDRISWPESLEHKYFRVEHDGI